MDTDKEKTMSEIMKILVVDDEEAVREVLKEVVREAGHECRTAGNAEEGIACLWEEPFQVVITDLRMPGMSGIEFTKMIKQINPETEVLLITSYASLDTALSALRLGAYDYLAKPFDDINLVFSAIERVVEKVKLNREKQSLVDTLERKQRELEELNESLKSLAVRDGLTGLFNRRYFDEALTTEIARCQRTSRVCSLLFLDVDHFKRYNDTNGHPQGDELLKTLAGILTRRLRKTDIVARYGGEEFVMLLPETSRDNALYCAEQICRLVREHTFPGQQHQPQGMVTVSIGVASFPDDGSDSLSLVYKADSALYRAKEEGRNRVCAAE